MRRTSGVRDTRNTTPVAGVRREISCAHFDIGLQVVVRAKSKYKQWQYIKDYFCHHQSKGMSFSDHLNKVLEDEDGRRDPQGNIFLYHCALLPSSGLCEGTLQLGSLQSLRAETTQRVVL